MKVWVGHGSEHSSRLILIGHFCDAEAARLTKERIRALDELALRQPEPDWERREEWYDEETRAALDSLRLWQIGPADLDNFRYEHGVSRDDNRLEIGTEEYEIQGLIKVLILQGARIEIYSRHAWNSDGTPVQPTDAETEDASEPDT
jgi:hypothetical protein